MGIEQEGAGGTTPLAALYRRALARQPAPDDCAPWTVRQLTKVAAEMTVVGSPGRAVRVRGGSSRECDQHNDRGCTGCGWDEGEPYSTSQGIATVCFVP